MKQRLQAWGDSRIIPIASCLVLNRNRQVLLLQRHSKDLGGGRWGMPGGRLESGEDAEMAALRELKEETGIEALSPEMLGVHQISMPHGSVHMTSYMVTMPGDVSIAIDPEEHHAFAWFDTEGLLDEDNLLWGIPTILRDFGLLMDFEADPTLSDGSKAVLLERRYNKIHEA